MGDAIMFPTKDVQVLFPGVYEDVMLHDKGK
jgi:hypothetical protein